MTKLRCPDSFEDAAVQAAALLGGVKALAAAVGREPGTVRKWGDPDQDGRPTIHQALVADLATAQAHKGHTPFLSAYRAQLADLLGDRVPAGDLVGEALDVPEAAGRLIALVHAATDRTGPAGSALSAIEQQRILAACADLEREIGDIKRAAKQSRGVA